MNLLRIKSICEEKGISLRSIASEINMSEQNLHRCIRVNKIQAEQLEIISKLLKVPIQTFFESGRPLFEHDEPAKDYIDQACGDERAEVETKKDARDIEIEHLRVLLAEKENIINEKERTIQILMNK